MNAKRWNELIGAVNMNNPAENVYPPLTGEELAIYKDMERELAEMRAKNPKAALWPVEKE